MYQFLDLVRGGEGQRSGRCALRGPGAVHTAGKALPGGCPTLPGPGQLLIWLWVKGLGPNAKLGTTQTP